MADKKLICNPCKKELMNDKGSVIFLCPNCEKAEIVRCNHCRKIAARFTCPNCGFMGPN